MKTIAVAAAVVALIALAPDRSAGGSGQARVTLFARPTTIAWAKPTQLHGAARGARVGETITVEHRECGTPSFQTLAEIRAGSAGGFSLGTGALLTTTFRAVFRNVRSNTVTVRQSPSVVLERERRGGRFVVTVTARKSYWRSRVRVERRTVRGWRTVRSVLLTDSLDVSGSLSASQEVFPLPVPRNTVVRAVTPRATCYEPGVSRSVRT